MNQIIKKLKQHKHEELNRTFKIVLQELTFLTFKNLKFAELKHYWRVDPKFFVNGCRAPFNVELIPIIKLRA